MNEYFLYMLKYEKINELEEVQMENYFNHKSVADLIDSVVNGKDKKEKVSLEKVLE